VIDENKPMDAGGMVVAACAVALTFAADERSRTQPADAAWQELQKYFRPPPPPWGKAEPTKNRSRSSKRKIGVLAGEAADKAKAFYTKYPTHPKAKEAQGMELKLLGGRCNSGQTESRGRGDGARRQAPARSNFSSQREV